MSSLALLQQLYPGKVVLSVEEIARCLNLSRDHIYRLASADKLPFPLAGVEGWGKQAFAAIRGEHVDVLFDAPRAPTWRGEH